MHTVNTVSGPLAVDQLGVTLMHEHVCMASAGMFLDSRVQLDHAARLALAVARLQAAKASGIDTVVDATPIDLHRDAAFIKEAAEGADIQIVCSTGLYTEEHGQPSHFKHMSAQQVSDLFVHELTDGIGATGIRAGVIKVATSEHGVTDVERKTLEAAADAQARTGVPIITHTSAGFGVEQAKILTGAGATPGKVMIGHVDHKYSSWGYFERILRTGVNIAFDRCGLQVFLPDTVRAALIAALIDLGLHDRVFVSMDSVCVQTGPVSEFEKDAPEPLTYVAGDFAAILARYGVSAATLQSMLTANPARLFGAA
ncbi:MAG: amidohydrolase family protein [Actinomycetota bacterium]|nr:amidohydrolase family protein [Actinomycetota bacterium]